VRICEARVGYRDPRPNEHVGNGGGQEIQLRGWGDFDCGSLRFEATKPLGADADRLGDGLYSLRSGSCLERAPVWDQRLVGLPGARSVEFQIPFHGEVGQVEQYCVTRASEDSDAWWWSNLARVETVAAPECR